MSSSDAGDATFGYGDDDDIEHKLIYFSPYDNSQKLSTQQVSNIKINSHCLTFAHYQ